MQCNAGCNVGFIALCLCRVFLFTFFCLKIFKFLALTLLLCAFYMNQNCFITGLYLHFTLQQADTLPPVIADMTDLLACQVASVQSSDHVTPPAACQKLIVLIGERQSCNKALRGDPPTQMKELRFVLSRSCGSSKTSTTPQGRGRRAGPQCRMQSVQTSTRKTERCLLLQPKIFWVFRV